jgi:hypothetical protein
MHDDVRREEQINLKLSAEELARLTRLAEREEITPQAMLRLLLKRAAEASTPPPAPKPSKPTRKR